jgi:DNA-binding MarR family transcriptional regulator
MSTVVVKITAGTTRDSARLGGALRRAWAGYRRRLDAALAEAGFEDHGFPDGRVLRLCARSTDATAADIGRELGMTRQGAAKIVADLRDRGYVRVSASPTDGREKHIRLTARARRYLEVQRAAARRIERDLRDEVGRDGFDALDRLLAALGDDDQPRLRTYLQRTLRNPRTLPERGE